MLSSHGWPPPEDIGHLRNHCGVSIGQIIKLTSRNMTTSQKQIVLYHEQQRRLGPLRQSLPAQLKDYSSTSEIQ